MAQRARPGQIVIQVGSATCEHAAGSDDVFDEFRKHIAASGREDIVLRQTGCTGRCSREPIVGVFVPGQMPVKYERVDREWCTRSSPRSPQGRSRYWITCSTARRPSFPNTSSSSAAAPAAAGRTSRSACPLHEKLEAAGVGPDRVRVIPASCFGACSTERCRSLHSHSRPARQGPLPRLHRRRPRRDPSRACARAARSSSASRSTARPVSREVLRPLRRRRLLQPPEPHRPAQQRRHRSREHRRVLPLPRLRGPGQGARQGRSQVGDRRGHAIQAPRPRRRRLSHRPEMGHGRRRRRNDRATSSATPTRATPARSWTAACSKSDPFSVIEGMIIGGFAIGAHRGFFYVRAEYPAGHPAHRERHRRSAASTACSARTSSAPASTSTWRSASAPGPSSAARKPR